MLGAWEMCTGISAWFKKLPLPLPVYALPCPLREAAALRQEETHGSISRPRALPASANGPVSQRHGWEVGRVLFRPRRRRVGNLWERDGGWLPGVLLVQQVSSQLCCGMKPYSIKNRTSGWHNAKKRSAARARE